jgi:putative hydrolase of HD superfamily
LVVPKERADLGKPHVDEWITPLLARLKTSAGKQLAQEIRATRWDNWWFNQKDDPHWVNGNKGA